MHSVFSVIIFYSFDTYFMSIYYVPDNLLGTSDTAIEVGERSTDGKRTVL